MTLRGVLCAVVEERDVLLFGELGDEPEGELLAVVLDCGVVRIDRGRREELGAVSSGEFPPRDLPRQRRLQQLLARTEVGHPDVVAIGRQAAPAKARGESPQPVARFDR